MRLSSILLAASAITLVASGNALSAVTDTEEAKVSKTTFANLALSDVDLWNSEGKRFLRGNVKDDNDEERLSSANMFNAEKIKQAVDDANYAKTLFRRWKRYGVEEKAAFTKLHDSHNLRYDSKVYKLYLDYVKWLDKHYPLDPTSITKNMFDKAKIDKALKDPTYANILFGRWMRNKYTMVTVREQFKSMDITTTNPKYIDWLKIHYPAQLGQKTTAKDFLFDRTRIDRTLGDETFANKLFAKWKSANYESDDVFKKFQTMGVATDDDLYKVYLNYLNWLEINHPLPPS